jgi:chaperonin GroEL
MSMTYRKVKSASKSVLTRGPILEAKVLNTMKTVSNLVGATLGPGGNSVLLERQEHGLPNFVTKDGVTVFRSIGFQDPVAHAIMESARDASVRTASEAGDGTTTATILAYSIVKNISEYCKKNPHVSPQKVIRKLQRYFRDTIEPTIRSCSIAVEHGTPEGDKLLWNVAKLSANGDGDLADAVIECLDLVGDKGNVTITEISGPTAYEVERIEGFPVNVGYEDSCGRFYAKFINDPGNQRVYVEKPIFLLFHGRVTDIQSIIFIMERIGMEWQANGFNHNVVLIASGFSESVLAQLAMNWSEPTTINVYPLLAPMNAIPNSQYDFMMDVAAITGAKIFDTLNYPLPRTHEEISLDDLGSKIESFESTRFRSTIVGQCDEVLTLERVDMLEKQVFQSSGSILETTYLQERIGKLTGGIAKLKVIGASNGELRERRDRAEDAIMAVRKSIEFGAIPGGGWALVRLVTEINNSKDEQLIQVLGTAFLEPVMVLFRNLGYSDAEIGNLFLPVPRKMKPTFWDTLFERKPKMAYSGSAISGMESKNAMVYDCQEGKWVNAIEGGILDSTPAVLEAIRNSLSIATLLGTLGGCIVYPRDTELERQEARDTDEYLRTVDDNPANERL